MSTKLVFGSGKKDADIVIVGEAPGYKEQQKGKPFVGRSGQLLTNLMSRAGIHRGDVYMTNVVKEKPYKNNIKPFIDANKDKVSKKGREYLDILYDELKETNPNVIVPVGNTALYAITGESGITNWRGSIMKSDKFPNTKIIPIIHPSAALRMYIYQHFIEHDLDKIRKEAKFPEFRFKERNYIIEPSFDESMLYLHKCLDEKEIGFDIEVYNYEVSCISFAPNEREAICIPFTKHARSYFNPEQELMIWKRIDKLLSHPDIKHIAQNAIFDYSFLYNRYGIIVSNLEDTMVAQGVSFPEFPKGLDFLCSIYTDMPYYKEDSKFKNPSISDRDFWIYNAKDSVVLPEIHRKQMEELERLNITKTYRKQVELIHPLVYMMSRGISMDVEKKQQKYIETEQTVNKLQAELNEMAGTDLNPNSPKQLKDYFYITKGAKQITENGKVTTNELALKKLSGKGHKEANIILNLRQHKTMNSRYYGMLLDKDNRLRCSFNPVGTTSGRLSSSKTIFGTGANMQNQPSGMKEIMQPDEDYTAYEIDLSQAENRVVAYLGADINMMKAFETGADIHSRTAAMIFNLTEEEVIEKKKKYEETGSKKYCAPIGHGDKPHRFWGKTANHAFNYDLGYVSFARRYEIPRSDSKFIHSGYHKVYPGVKKMHNMIKNQLRSNRRLTNLLGRTRVFMDRWSDPLFKEAYSFIPQSTVADIINRYGMLEIYNDQETYSAVELLNQVHDSIIFQIPNSLSIKEHYLILKSICTSMETTLEWRGNQFQIPAEVTVMPNNFKDGYEIGKITNMSETEALTSLEEALQNS